MVGSEQGLDLVAQQPNSYMLADPLTWLKNLRSHQIMKLIQSKVLQLPYAGASNVDRHISGNYGNLGARFALRPRRISKNNTLFNPQSRLIDSVRIPMTYSTNWDKEFEDQLRDNSMSKESSLRFHCIRLFLYTIYQAGLRNLDDIPDVLNKVLKWNDPLNAALWNCLKAFESSQACALAAKLFEAAIKDGHRDRVAQLADTGLVDINWTSITHLGSKHTPLQAALHFGHCSIAILLLSKGSDVNLFHPEHRLRSRARPLFMFLEYLFFLRSHEICSSDSELFDLILNRGAIVDPYIFSVISDHPAKLKPYLPLLISRLLPSRHQSFLSSERWYNMLCEMTDTEASALVIKFTSECVSEHGGNCLIRSQSSFDESLLKFAKRGWSLTFGAILSWSSLSAGVIHPRLLIASIQGRDPKILDLVMARRPDLNPRAVSINDHRETPLAEVIRVQHSSLLQIFDTAGVLLSLHTQDRLEAALLAAIEIRNDRLATRLLKEGFKGAEMNLSSCLTRAIELGDKSLVKSLVEAGATTTIFWDRYSSADRNLPDIAIIRLLLETGALNDINRDFIIPMTAHIEYETIITDLLSVFFDGWGSIRLFGHKEHENFQFSNKKAQEEKLKSDILYQALSHENSRKWILTSGLATVSLLTDSLIPGIMQDDVKFVKSLIHAGADTFDELTLEIAATYRSHFLQTLIQHGRQKSAQMPKHRLGSIVIKRAIMQGPGALNDIKYLINSGEVELMKGGSTGHGTLRTPLGEAINMFKEFPAFSYDVVKMLLESGCDPNSIVERHLPQFPISESIRRNVTALLKSIETGNKELVELLISRGAHVNGKIPYFVRRNPLQMAAEIGNMEIIELLLDQGADINADPAFRHGGTALQLAAIYGDCYVAAELLRRGALLHKPPSKVYGRWPIEGAAEHGRFEMIEFLWKANSEIMTFQDSDNGFEEKYLEKAMRLATTNGHYSCRDLIAELSGLDPTATDLPPKPGPIYIDWPPPGWSVETSEGAPVYHPPDSEN
ncbi:ankyrin repeat-containing domain protein [Xylaria curta]|nr:ankyrin repeat-containing domain protein [Xylaria curta]